MFNAVTNFKDFEDSQLVKFIKDYHSLVEINTNETVETANYTLNNLYGLTKYSNKYDNGDNLGLGNIKQLIGKIEKALTKSFANKNPIRLPLAATQLNECASDLAALLISPNDSYTAFSSPASQEYVQAIAKKMSEDATRFNHFDHLLKAIKCVLHYGVCSMRVDWEKDSLHQIQSESLNDNPHKGCKLTILNPAAVFYNKLEDMRQFSELGEYCCIVESIAKTELLDQKIHEGIDKKKLIEILQDSNSGIGIVDSAYSPRYYDYLLDFNPYSKMTDDDNCTSKYLTKTTVYMRITKELLPCDISELPEFTKVLIKLTYIGTTLINAETSDNGIIPVIISPVILGATPASNLIPVQKFINFLINVKQQGDRKRIYGINFYDRNKINLNDIGKAQASDEVTPYIGCALNAGESLQGAIQHFNDSPDTKSIVSDITQMKDIMQIILPTDTSSLMGSLERATEWQAKKTLEQSGKFTKLLGRILQSGFINPLTALQIQTIFSNETTIDVTDDEGQQVPTAIAEFMGKDIMFSITTALNGVDRDIKAGQMETFLNRLIQLPNVAKEYDLTKLFDYQSSLTGHKIDFSQFKNKAMVDNLPIEQRELASQLLQQYLVEQQGQQNSQQSVDNNQ